MKTQLDCLYQRSVTLKGELWQFCTRFLILPVILCLGTLAGNAATPFIPGALHSIAELKTQTALTNYGDMIYVAGYYGPGDRGGGWFVLTNATSQSDGGMIFTNAAGNGRWMRLLNGETANIVMWGATFLDGSPDDTIAIQNALQGVRKEGRSYELLIPEGTYDITNTIVFSGYVHIRGEGNPAGQVIRVQRDVDAFRSQGADDLIHGGINDSYYSYDHGLLIENFQIRYDTNAVSGAGLVLRNPGEANAIRNMSFINGGYGIKVLGAGAPGLSLYNISPHDQYVAGVSFESYLPADSTNYIGAGGGPVTIIGLSGDHRRADSDATACLLRAHRSYAILSVRDVKAEGQFGGGVINYRAVAGLGAGGISVDGMTYNCGPGGDLPSVPCDVFVTSSEDGFRTVPIHLKNFNIYNTRYLIRDDMTGRNVYPNTDSQMNVRIPIQYESYRYSGYGTNMPSNSRLTIGSSQVYSFHPPTNGWYRVMFGRTVQLAGTLTITTYAESTQLQVDTHPADNVNAPWISVVRPNRNDTVPIRVTQARSGLYYDPQISGNCTYLDINVSTKPESWEFLTVSLPVTDEYNAGDPGLTQLVCPTAPLTSETPPGCTLLRTKTESLIR